MFKQYLNENVKKTLFKKNIYLVVILYQNLFEPVQIMFVLSSLVKKNYTSLISCYQSLIRAFCLQT